MPTYKAPLKDFEFIIKDYLALDQYNDVPGFEGAGELAMPLLEEGAKFCENVLFPLNQSGDAEGCKYENGMVRMPKGFKEAYAQYVGGGWASFTCNPEWGGQGLPEVLNMPMTEMICSANLSFGLTPGLSHSAYNLMEKYCPAELKPRFMPKLVSGEWAGVMCLTEPNAGTDLGLLRTKAEPVSLSPFEGEGLDRGAIRELKVNGEAHPLPSPPPQRGGDILAYKITGNKIFISSGEQDITENIVHLVLAKLPDAPKGSRGISLFLVSKFLVNEDGSLGERNKVQCAGIEHKMGIHGSSTCVMNYDEAVGYLIGEPHRGLPAMFAMMNSARIYVGVQGLGLVEVAYQNALAYANERLQGRALTGAVLPEKPADPITVHPDVRKMLLTQRVNAEAGRALVMLTALKHDLAHRHPDPAVREEADDFVQLMTPIVKAHLTDLGFEMSSLGMQCFGGYGYIKEYGAEQYVRDARIAMIYEGTNGVQAMDLVGRKLPHRFGKYMRAFFHPALESIVKHKTNPEMAEFIKPLEKHIGYLQQASLWLAQKGLSNPNDAAAGSVEYLRLFAQVVFAWIWAEQASIALAKLSAKEGDAAFYKDKLDNARFYYARILPSSVGLLAGLTQGSKSIMEPNLKVS